MVGGWAVGTILEADPPAPVQPSDDSGPDQCLSSNPSADPEPKPPN